MKLTIESTTQLTEIDGVPVRLWKGITEQGTACLVFVHRLAVAPEADAEEFAAELVSTTTPAEAFHTVPLVVVLEGLD